jgi:hypothetical protein
VPDLFSGQDSTTFGGGIPTRRQNRFWIYNSSGEEIPSYAPMELSTQNVTICGGYCWNVIKPTGDSLQNIVFNEGHPLPIDRFGYGTLDYLNGGILAAYDGTAPAVGDSIGTASGTWKMKVDNTGFTALNADDTNKVCAIQPAGGGGGGGTIAVVQTVSGGMNGYVNVKAIQLKANPLLRPNFEQIGDATPVRYFAL